MKPQRRKPRPTFRGACSGRNPVTPARTYEVSRIPSQRFASLQGQRSASVLVWGGGGARRPRYNTQDTENKVNEEETQEKTSQRWSLGDHHQDRPNWRRHSIFLHFARQNLKTASSTRTGVLLLRHFADLLTRKRRSERETDPRSASAAAATRCT